MVAYLTVVILAVVIGVPAYLHFFALLRDRHPDAYRALGSPTLFNRSPRRGLAIQRYIYSSEPLHLDDPALTRIVWLLRLFVPILLVALAWGISRLLGWLPRIGIIT